MSETLNPYESPQGDLQTGEAEFGTIKLLRASCRIGRLRYLSHAMLLGLMGYAGMIPSLLLVMTESTPLMILGGIIGVAAYIFILYGSIVCGIQRLHDLNQSGWLILLMFVPLANLVLIIFLVFVPGTQGVNKWGNPPPPNKTWNVILALFMPVIAILGIVAAIALPAYQDYTQRAQSAETVDWSE